MLRRTLFIIGVLLLAGTWRGLHASGEIVTSLLFGWVGFLRRVVPQVESRGDGWLVFLGALLIATAFAHRLASWYFSSFNASAAVARPAWKVRWTASLVSLVIVMFSAGICLVGAAHQAAWLLTSDTPWFGRTVDAPYNSSRSNLKNLGLAVDNTASVHGFSRFERDAENPVPQSWVTSVIPYLNGPYLPVDVDGTVPWDHPDNADEFRLLVPELLNPALRNAPLRDLQGFGLNHYAGNSSVFESTQPIDWDDLRQKSNLLLIGEVNSHLIAWGHPDNSRDPGAGLKGPEGFGGPFGSTGVHFVMADGSVRVIDRDVDEHVLRAMSRVSR